MTDTDTTTPTGSENWQERAAELHEQGGIPKRRAKVVALVEAGRTHSEVADTLDMNDRSNVGSLLHLYREEDLSEADWLSANGPRI